MSARDDDLDRELRSHVELETDDQRDAGLSPEDARYAALRALGNEARIREEVRDVWRRRWIAELGQDLRFGLRLFRANPGFTAVAVLTLALGIGATSAIFSVVDAVLLQPLPYPHPRQLAMIWENVNLPAYRNEQNTPAPGNFADWKARSSAFADMAAIGFGSWGLTGAGEPARIEGEAVSASFFSVLQVTPAIGRAFAAEEDRPGGARVVVLGHALWMDRFGADPRIVGRTIRLNDEPYTVVGVMPRGFHFPDPDDQIWTPIALTPQQLANHGSHFLRVVARLRPEVTIAQAQAQLATIAEQLTRQYPDSNSGVGVSVVSLDEQTVGSVRRTLLVLLGVVGFVMLMVCVNVANLLLARSSARSRELAIRLAIGASRLRVLRQLLTESALLAMLGGAVGLVMAWWGVAALRGVSTSDVPRIDEIRVDGWVCAFTVIVSLGAGLIFGVVPALQSGRRDLHAALEEGGRLSAARSRLRWRNALVVVETALGVVVLVGAGLLLRSFLVLQQVPLGFDIEDVLSLRVILPAARYPTLAGRTAFYKESFERIAAVPGVRSVAAITFLPLTFDGRTAGVTAEGERVASTAELRFVDFRSVTPGYFATLGVPIAGGRDVSWTDTPERPLVAVASEAAVRKFWPDANPIGKRFKLGRVDDPAPWLTVVGIVGNVRQLDLVSDPRPAVYFPITQDQGTGDTLRDWVVKTSADPASVGGAVRAAIWSIDPDMPISRVQPMRRVHSATLARRQFSLSLAALFGALALALASIGLYGVTSYSIAQRTHELGVRIALGARRRDVLGLVFGQGARLALIGLALGCGTALALSKLMAALLFGVSSRDPITFAGVAALLLTVVLTASYVPARRALRIDPSVALRYQ